MNNNLFITPEDSFEHEIQGHKFEIAPITVADYMMHASLFADPKTLNVNQQTRLRDFVASKIKSIDGEQLGKTDIHRMTPIAFFAVVDAIVQQLNLKESEKIFHQDKQEG